MPAPIDDRVMGGISHSTMRHDPAGHAIVEEAVERNGDLSSVRSTPAARGLSGAAICAIETRGDNRQFRLSLPNDGGFDGLNCQARFMPWGTAWQSLHLPLATFRASFRVGEIAGAPELDPARIRQVGLMIAARLAGSFALDIRRISLS